MGGFGGEELGCEIARGGVVGVAALAGLTELELRVGGLEALVVGWAAEGFFATGLVENKGLESWWWKYWGRETGIHTGSKVGLWAVVMLAVGCVDGVWEKIEM